jgi:hypothetical protein
VSWPGMLVLGLFLTGSLSVRADLLEDAKAKRAIEAQRLERLVSDADANATRLLRSNRLNDAVDVLRNILAVLEVDQSLAAERRETLMRKVRLSLKQLETDATAPRYGSNPDPVRVGVGEQRRVEEEKKRAEADYINRTQAQIRQAQQAGNSREAARLQDQLSQRNPSNPAIQAGRIVGGVSESVAARDTNRGERDRGFMMVGASVDRANRVPLGDMEFPPDWAEKTKKRSNAMLITEKEQAILKALNTVIDVDFTNATFEEVINYLQKRTGLPISVDKLALAEAGITYETPVTAKIRASARGVLRKILGELNLTYVMKDEALQVMTFQRAQVTMSVRNYYVGDLVAATSGSFNPVFNQLQMALQVQQLAVLITQTIEPSSWMVNGGLGTIVFNPISMSFMVRQTAEMHYLMGASMR